MCDTCRTNGYEDLIRAPLKECDWQESGACVGAPPVAPLFAIKAVRVSQVGPTVATPKHPDVLRGHSSQPTLLCDSDAQQVIHAGESNFFKVHSVKLVRDALKL